MKPYQKEKLWVIGTVFGLFSLYFICSFFGEGFDKQSAYFWACSFIVLAVIYWVIFK